MIAPNPPGRKRIEDYLKKFPSDFPRSANFRPVKIVIPCYAESDRILDTLSSLAAQRTGRDLVEAVVVVNNSVRPDPKIFADNQNTISLLRSELPGPVAIRNAGILLTVLDHSTLSSAFPENLAGVGSARKAGLDYALAQLSLTGFAGVLGSLDADCLVSENYVQEIVDWSSRDGRAECAIVEYAHPMPDDPALRRAAALYEIRLRYTQIALSRIDTPYAFSTIGSTIVCTPEGYATAGGMNTRKATEDFYFLMNMAKTTRIDRIHGALVMPASRVSDRVYLGTGHGIGKLLAEGNDLLLEHPACYAQIGKFLCAVLDGFGRDPDCLIASTMKSSHGLTGFLDGKRFDRALRESLSKTTSPESYRRRIHQWFDGLKIRQAVHHLRDHTFGTLPWYEAAKLLIGEAMPEDPVAVLARLRQIDAGQSAESHLAR